MSSDDLPQCAKALLPFARFAPGLLLTEHTQMAKNLANFCGVRQQLAAFAFLSAGGTIRW